MAKPTQTITNVPENRVEAIKQQMIEGGAESVEVKPDDEGGFFKLIVTWPEGTILE
ncbi:MAG TPA: hypothetical protein VF782_01405 [Allosphingosinicella sp.]|jgi:hypothetical protein